jgi:hypothetical protein
VSDDAPRKRPIDYRDARLVNAMLGLLAEQDEPIREDEFLELFAGTKWQPATVARTMRELVDFGAIRRLTPLRKPVALRISPLGAAWFERRLEPYVREDQHDPDDPVEVL